MSKLPIEKTRTDNPWNVDQKAELEAAMGPCRVHMRVKVTPAGMLAVAGLVSGILLSTAALVRVARRR